MNKFLLLTILGLLQLSFAFGQGQEQYSELINEASDLYDSNDFFKSGQIYTEALAELEDKEMVIDRYNAACSWALANKPDFAFEQLLKIAKHGNYSNLGHIEIDSDLNSLHKDKRWKKVIKLVKANKEKAEAKLDKPLVARLDVIYEEDQAYRQELDEIEEKYGRESDEVKAHWKIIGEKDSLNLIKVKEILDERGWLGKDIIGRQGNATLFLVIQHADIETQEKYLPMLQEAVAKGNARGADLALLEDRIALRNGQKQTYGSQIGHDKETGEHYVLPVIDPDKINQRREQMGLGTIQNYLSIWGMTWDVEAYKKKLPEYEAKLREKLKKIK